MSESFERIGAVFHAVLACPPEDRQPFLDAACANDAGLRCELEALLTADQEANQDAFLEAPLTAFEVDDPDVWMEPSFEDRQIGPYRLIEELGRGGMGVVWLAERQDVHKRVALKFVRHSLASPDYVARFFVERRILARLDHPYIARLLDAGVTGEGTPFFVMEFIEGEPITEYCIRNRLGIDQRLDLFEIVCEAVRYAHHNLVVHRDLKPSNILVSEAGGVKLLDFGIAKLLSSDATELEGLTQAGLPVMTPEYAAPEQLTGGPITTATDVYALGLLLYELFTGHRPFDADKHKARRPSEATKTPGKPSAMLGPAQAHACRTTREQLRRRLHGDLDMICLKALREESDRRYASAEQLLADVRRHREGRPVHARPATFGYQIRKFVERNRVGALVATLFLVLFIGYVGTLTRQAQHLAAERDRTQREAVKSARVSAFLVDVFSKADPFAQTTDRIDTMRVADLLKARGLDVMNLNDQPEVQADLLEVVGRMYQGMGLVEHAQQAYEQEMAVRRALYENDPADPNVEAGLAAGMNNLGGLHWRAGRYAEAEPLLKEALERTEQLYGPEHERVAEVLNNLGDMYREMLRIDEAEPLLRRALAIRRRLPEAAPSVGQSLNNLGLVLLVKGELEEAEMLFRQAIEEKKIHLGPDHPSVPVAIGNLALVSQDQGRLDEAETLLRNAIALKEQRLGRRHWRVALNMHNLAGLLHDKGELDEAERWMREMVSIYTVRFGEGQYRLTDLSRGLADLLIEEGRYAEADSMYQAALIQFQNLFKEDHAGLASVRIRYGNLLVLTGDLDRAKPLIEAGLAVRQQRYGADDWRTAEARSALGALWTAQGRYEEAEPLLLESLDRIETVQGPPDQSRFTRKALLAVITHYKARNRPDEAALYLARLPND